MGSVAKLEREGRVDLNGAGKPVQIGARQYTLVPQKIGRLRSRLPLAVGSLENLGSLSEGATVDSLIGMGLERAHAVLKVFIPDLMPVYEFCGFQSQSAMDEGDYDEEADPGPDIPQVRHAFETAMVVNSLDLIKHLKNVFGPELVRAVVQEQVLTRIAESSPTQSLTSTSSTSGPESAESTPSGTTPPTESESTG